MDFMREIRELESQRNEIKVALDDVCSKFHRNAMEAIGLGLYVNNDYTVCGEARLLTQNANLVERVNMLGQRVSSLNDEFTDVDYRLNNLYHAKFEELRQQFTQNLLSTNNIERYEQDFRLALNDRRAGDFLEELQHMLLPR